MSRVWLLAAAVLVLSCASEPSTSFELDAGNAVSGRLCSPPAPCYPTCDPGNGTCAKGTLDLAACVCRNEDGDIVPWPDGTQHTAQLDSIAFDPQPPSQLALERPFTLKVRATYDDSSQDDVTADATLNINPPNALESLGGGSFRAVMKGSVTVTATFAHNSVERIAQASFTVMPEEARAVWVTRFSYSTADDVRRIVNAAADAHFNVVLFQVRGVGDAFYKSTIEPWSAELGALGRDPGWDPLQIAIDTAHARGIELHAYVNVFTGWSGTAAIPETTPPHVLKAHPDWVEQDSTGGQLVENMLWLSPGVPAVRAHNLAVVREILTNYDVDGIHLDRIRYSGSEMGHNALSQQAFQTQYGGAANKFKQFRTDSVNAQVRAIYDAVQELKPTAKLSAAVWGIHTRLPNCHTSEGTSYYFQDSLAWTEGGYIDALAPMIYWDNGTSCTDYATLLSTFQALRGDRQIWAGMHANPCANNCSFNWDSLAGRIGTARTQRAAGITIFASALLDSADAWSLLGGGPFAEAALVPPKQ